jgi:hypothetical protein
MIITDQFKGTTATGGVPPGVGYRQYRPHKHRCGRARERSTQRSKSPGQAQRLLEVGVVRVLEVGVVRVAAVSGGASFSRGWARACQLWLRVSRTANHDARQ